MKKLLASTALLCALALPGHAQDYTPDPAAKAGGSITVTYKDDVATLDPAIGYDWQNWSMIKSLFDGLMDYVPGSTDLRLGLAESYEISEDGLSYTFKLRPGVKFHNGREMTADDVKYSLDRVTLPATQSPGSGFFASIKGYDAMVGGTAGTTTVAPIALRGVARSFAGAASLPRIESADDDILRLQRPSLTAAGRYGGIEAVASSGGGSGGTGLQVGVLALQVAPGVVLPL